MDNDDVIGPEKDIDISSLEMMRRVHEEEEREEGKLSLPCMEVKRCRTVQGKRERCLMPYDLIAPEMLQLYRGRRLPHECFGQGGANEKRIVERPRTGGTEIGSK